MTKEKSCDIIISRMEKDRKSKLVFLLNNKAPVKKVKADHSARSVAFPLSAGASLFQEYCVSSQYSDPSIRKKIRDIFVERRKQYKKNREIASRRQNRLYYLKHREVRRNEIKISRRV